MAAYRRYALTLPRSLKFRMTAVVILLVLLATMTVTSVALMLAEQDMKAVIGDQQYALLSSTAAQVDAGLGAKKLLLGSLAEVLPDDAASTPAAFLAFVRQHPIARREFRNLHLYTRGGALLHTRGDGVAALDVPPALHRYFQQVLNDGKAIVSPPYRSVLTGSPAVIILQPLVATSGRPAMLLGGSIDLASSTLLDHVAGQKPGKTGYTFIMTTEGVLVQHPDRRLLLENISRRPGVDPGLLRALGGFEGWSESTQTGAAAGPGEGDGGRPPAGSNIDSYKRLRNADWIVGARYPVEVAFAPMIAMRHQGLLAAAAFAVLAGVMA